MTTEADVKKLMDEIKKNNEEMLKKYRSPLTERFSMERFAPYYNDKADYNTDSASYYDFLARYLRFIRGWECVINALLGREIQTGETPSIKLLQAAGNNPTTGNWEDGDDITLTGNVKLSTQSETADGYTYPNAISTKDDGLYSKDFTKELEDIQNELKDIQNHLSKIDNEIDKIFGMLQNKYNTVSRDALKFTLYNNWYLKGQVLDMSYIKTNGAVTCRFTSGYTNDIGFKNDDIQNNLEYAANNTPEQVPKSAIFGVTLDNSKLPDEIKDLDFSKVIAVGDCQVQQFAGQPDPNVYPAIAYLSPVTNYPGLTMFISGMSNGYLDKLGTTVLMTKCIGFLMSATITFSYPFDEN